MSDLVERLNYRPTGESDIVERLRSYHKDSAHGALHEAADEIERLREFNFQHGVTRTADLKEIERLQQSRDDWHEIAQEASTVHRAATIEECAQIAKQYLTGEAAAAAIRALKEQT